MIKTILITGLDGSGKSTLFSKLEAKNLNHVALISVLHTDIASISDSSSLKKPIELLNEMSEEADKDNSDSLKAMALFSAMILFHKLVAEKTTLETKIIICERHPLIDTFVYAQYYLPRLNSGNTDLEKLMYYNTKYETLFSFVLEQLPIENKDLGAYTIYKFIKEFFVKKTAPDAETESIFKTNVPDKIFFLKAPVKILMERISCRKVIEAHEKTSILSGLEATYDNLFKTIAKNNDTTIKNIEASSFESLDNFYSELIKEIKN
ncbi:hypothetical protein [Polaribacter vadi]|uniref:hypothetical protein n=1 Tax=Polaribacter vadi TaxID=1774273 RepID=UPI0030EBC0F8|tara:strand:+ start:6931 stop:7725 length:795 start_codon:yes stop_codon:yes gene_type:complete